MARSKQTQDTETAEQAYARLSAKVAAQLETLKQRLEQHAAAQKSDPKNWGLVGDMSSISRRLGECLGEEE